MLLSLGVGFGSKKKRVQACASAAVLLFVEREVPNSLPLLLPAGISGIARAWRRLTGTLHLCAEILGAENRCQGEKAQEVWVQGRYGTGGETHTRTPPRGRGVSEGMGGTPFPFSAK